MPFIGSRVPVWLLFIFGIPVLWLLWLGAYAISPGPPSSAKQIEVVIPSNMSLSAIRKILAENKVIDDDPRFAMLAMLAGAATKLRAGEYAFEPGSKPLEVIDLLLQSSDPGQFTGSLKDDSDKHIHHEHEEIVPVLLISRKS